MKAQYILFDLDGTLTDSMCGIVNSVKYALNKLNLEIPPEPVLKQFLGPPLSSSFHIFCNMTMEEAQHAVSVYREYFSTKGLFENEVYEGIVPMLEQLKDAGYYLATATSKPEIYTLKIMEHFDLTKYFEFIAGSSMDESRNTKAAVIRHAMRHLSALHNQEDITQSTIMVGDRKHDIEGAKECEIKSIGALWGYGGYEELKGAGADVFVKTPQDLVEMIKNN